jgi:glycosyltransferase involved in cell wall biosynthesis
VNALESTTDNRLTIGLVSSYGLHVGGVETHLLSLIKYSDKARFRFVLVGPISPELTAQAEALGAQVVQWKTKRVTHVTSLFRLWHILRAYDIDVVHFHCPRAAFMARPLTRLLKIPTTVTVQLPPYYFKGNGYVNRSWGSWLYKKLERVLNYWFTDKLIYASFQVMEEARAMGLVRDENTVFIGNGVNLGNYGGNHTNDGPRHELRQEYGVKDHERLFCCVGRLDQQKGLDVLIEAFSWINPKAKNAKLWFVGDGPLRSYLQELVRREGLLDCVSFLGFRKDIPQILRAADVFVLPSRFEAMPLSIIEAMAAGLPCVVSDTGENSLMVEDGVNGFIIPIEDVKALAEAMETLNEDALRCKMMGKASREKSGHYSDEITVRRIQQIYELIAPAAKAKDPMT